MAGCGDAETMIALLRRLFLRRLGSQYLGSQRLGSTLAVVAVALGVALGLAVQLVHQLAIDEFSRGMRQFAGAADLQVVGGREGFDEALYLTLARDAELASTSPLLRVVARLPASSPERLPTENETLEVLGVDLFRLQQFDSPLLERHGLAQPAGQAGDQRFAGLLADRAYLSASARAMLRRLQGGDERLRLQVGLDTVELAVAGELPRIDRPLAVMDIAAAQQLFGRIGVLSQIDLRLADGVDLHRAQQRLAGLMPAGVSVREPEAMIAETAALTRAYRVNLSMLAMIALLTGGFLVFSTQLLSVSRRQREFALLRALGMTRRELLTGVLAEGGLIGVIGSLSGIVLAYVLTYAVLSVTGTDLGAGFFRAPLVSEGWAMFAVLPLAPWAIGLHFCFGLAAGLLGSWLPARAAARIVPAQGLKNTEVGLVLLPAWSARSGPHSGQYSQRRWTHPLSLLAILLPLIVLASLLPAWQGVPVGAYLAIALSLLLAVLCLPVLASVLLPALKGVKRLEWRLARRRLLAAPQQAVIAAAGIVVSVALAASMMIMVNSFRHSVDDWLAQLLPGDLYLRAANGSDSAFFDEADLARIAAVEGVTSVDTTRQLELRLSASEPRFTLLARAVEGNWGLPLLAGQRSFADGESLPLWLSEAGARRLQRGLGDELSLPLAGREQRFVIAGIWRDYGRQHGAALIRPQDYVALSGDRRINDVALRLEGDAKLGQLEARLAQLFGEGEVLIARPGEIRARSLEIFDRTFLITYLMEVLTIVIGLFGIATTFAVMIHARAAEFGMLRHLGFTRGELGRLIAFEGGLTAALGVGCGLGAGLGMAWILIARVNVQSFNWSMDFALPWTGLAVLGLAVIGLAAMIARVVAARLMAGGALQAVKADC